MKHASTVVVLAVAALLVSMRDVRAVPQYAAQAGRTCDSCHILPGDLNTPRLAHQKRNMSCGTCHVDPSGGGMRTTTGRYYGRATLPVIATSPRPQDDWNRNFPGLGRRDKATPYNGDLPAGPRD